MVFAFDREHSEERLARCVQCMYTELGDPDNIDAPTDDYSHIPINTDMLAFLADGITAAGAKRGVLSDPVQMRSILGYEDWIYRATCGTERDPGLWY